MKKLLLPVAVVATLGFASCGGADVCSCMELSEEMMKLESMDEMEKFAEEHKDELDACEKLGKDMGEEEAEKAAKDCK